MKAKLKGLHSPDVFDLKNYKPHNKENFSFLLQIMVGPENEEGEESFDVEVCTLKWLEMNYGEKEVIIGYHYIIVREYNYEKIETAINNFLKDCTGGNWEEIALKVSRLGIWEFDNYINS